MSRTTVYLLGAGCSVKYGYPLASQFVEVLDSFGKSLSKSAEKIRRCVEETVTLMRKGNIQTLDDLTSRIHNGVFDESQYSTPDVSSRRLQRTRDAKIATYALFLSKESAAKRTGLAGYHNFLLKLCPGAEHWSQRIRKANCHVLTFNYDRLFEMGVRDRFAIPRDDLLYGPLLLNSGLGDARGQPIEFEPGRFCFLKLHGSVGVRVWEDVWGQHYKSHFDGGQPGDDREITDDLFFAGNTDPDPSRARPEPLIVFPHEIHHLQSGQPASLPFGDYISKVWDQAAQLIAGAEDIWVIGYSFAVMDIAPLMKLLAKATACRRIVVQNLPGEAERICAMLKVEHPEITIRLEPYRAEF